MAIQIERKGIEVNWFAIAVTAFVLIFIGATTYFLFFTQQPLIQTIAPIDKSVDEIVNQVRVDKDSIVNNPVFSKLDSHNIPLPDAGILGRPNPFAPI